MRHESDEEVRQNIPQTLMPIFDRVRTLIVGSDRKTRTETFLQYVEDHPGEEIEASARVADFRLKALIRPMLDFYETPAWAIQAIAPVLPVKPGDQILDPCCGTGAILREIGAMYPEHEILGIEKEEGRFLAAEESTELPVVQGDFFDHRDRWDVIVANPPYSHALQFVQHAMTIAPVVCMLLRLPWLASQARAKWHRENPAHVCVLPKRPSFTGDGKTDATEYAWFVWGDPDRAGRWTILTIDPSIVPKRTRKR